MHSELIQFFNEHRNESAKTANSNIMETKVPSIFELLKNINIQIKMSQITKTRYLFKLMNQLQGISQKINEEVSTLEDELEFTKIENKNLQQRSTEIIEKFYEAQTQLQAMDEEVNLVQQQNMNLQSELAQKNQAESELKSQILRNQDLQSQVLELKLSTEQLSKSRE